MGKNWDSFAGKVRESSQDERDAYREGNPGRPGYGFSCKSATPKNGERQAFVAFMTEVFAEALRVVKPCHYALVWSLPRTSHWTGWALEEAGWEMRDQVLHIFGCLSEDTEILTDNGWRHYHDLREGDNALAYNTVEDLFGWEKIQEVPVYDYCDTAYRILSDSTDQIVSRNHRCLVKRGGGYSFRYAETLECEACVPILEDVQCLLRDICLPQSHAGSTKQDLLSNVYKQDNFFGKQRQEEARPDMSAVWSGISFKESHGHETESVQVLQHEVRSHDQGVTTSLSPKNAVGWGDGEVWVDGYVDGILPRENERGEKSGLEGWSDVSQVARELQGGKVYSVSGGVYVDGAQGWLCDGAPIACGTGHRSPFDETRGCPSQGSRSTKQHLEQSGSLCLQSGSQAVRGSRYTKSNLAMVIPFHYEGKVWCVRVPSGAFVARRNGKVFVTGNSGFPKGKAALKPSYEGWWLCRAPGKGVLPLSIDECRIPCEGGSPSQGRRKGKIPIGDYNGWNVPSRNGYDQPHPGEEIGRWPGNLTHDGSDEVMEAFAEFGEKSRGSGEKKVSSGGFNRTQSQSLNSGGINTPGRVNVGVRDFGDSGTAARFFYCAKASRSDRGEGNNHPTVKNTKLMEWLVRLITKENDLVLDCFCGSGSTGVACVRSGRRFLGIDQSAEYIEIARRRLQDAVDECPMFSNLEPGT